MKALLVGLVLLVVSGCSPADGSPREVVENYLAAEKSRDALRAYEFISDADKEFYSLEDVQSEHATWNEYWAAEMLRETRYEIVSEVVGEDSASVIYAWIQPNLEHVFSRASELSAQRGSEYYRDFDRYVNDYIDSRGYELRETRKKIDLTLQDDGWKVFLDVESKRRQQEVRRLEGLAFIAEVRDKDHSEARDLYSQILRLDADNEEARLGLARAEDALALQKALDEYKSLVEVYDVDARMFESRIDGIVPGATYKVRNHGDRGLKRVEVLFTFYDEEGVAIYEDSAIPVLDGALSRDRGLPPGHIWQTERGRFRSFKSLPDEWDGESVSVEVIEIEFSD